MYNSKRLFGFVLFVLIITCFLLSVFFEFNGNKVLSFHFHSVTAPLITVSYLFYVKQKNIFFLLFLLTYSLADFCAITMSHMTIDSMIFDDIEYYIGNGLYVLSYVFLIVKLIKSLDFKFIIKSFKVHVAVLALLNIYFLYVLQKLIYPNLIYENDFYLECSYNIVILLLLSLALLNYFHKDNKKALYLFTGSLLIVFSEVMDLALIYVVDRSFIRLLSFKLAIIGFYFFYEQSKLLNISNDDLDNLTVTLD